MIIDYTQGRDGVDISYVNEKRQIVVERVILNDGYYDYVECEENDPDAISNLKSFKNSGIKKERTKYFRHHNINEFFGIDIPENHPDLYKKISTLTLPKLYSVDIETDIDPVKGYSSVENPFNAIRSISITDERLKTLFFIVKDPTRKINDFDKVAIDQVLKESLEDFYTDEISYIIKEFDSEEEMLIDFLRCMNEYFHLIMGWNIGEYDWKYICARCAVKNIDIKIASPTRKKTKYNIKVRQKSINIELEIPQHRVIVDYMVLFKASLTHSNLGSYSLNNISDLILKLKKVSYTGNLRTLYLTNYPKFIAYALVDTLLVMLLHKATNMLNVDFFQSYYTNVPYIKLSQNSISEALVYNALRDENKFLLESEKTENVDRPYEGGYVKAPTKKNSEGNLGLDYGSLYPNAMITGGLSPEAKVDEIKTNENGRPLRKEDEEKWVKYKDMGYTMSPKGRIYDISKDFLYTKIEKNLLAERKIFRKFADDIYLGPLAEIEKELKKREIEI